MGRVSAKVPIRKLASTDDVYDRGFHKGNPGGLDAVDTDLAAANIKDGVTIFGFLGTFASVPHDIAVAHDTDPFVSAYPWTPGGGFGAKYADPAAKPAGNGSGVAFCGNTDIAVAHSTDPFVSAYPWTPGGGFGVKYADPAAKPASTSAATPTSPWPIMPTPA